MTELKTLKDIGLCQIYCKAGEECINKVIKQLTIKWVKEDKKSMEKGTLMDEGELLSKWMKRLDITEEDLK